MNELNDFFKNFDFEKLQGTIDKLEAKYREIEVTEEAGAGMVVVTMNGARKLVRVELDPELLNKNEKNMLEDLIVAAVNKATQAIEAELQRFTLEEALR